MFKENIVRRLLKGTFIYRFLYQATLVYFMRFPFVISCRKGIRYFLDRRELIDRSIYFGSWERATVYFIENFVKNGDVVIEVGANVGAHTMLLAKQVGSNGKVIAFEPTDFALTKLRVNVLLNPSLEKRIGVFQYIVTDNKKATPKLNIRSSWALGSSYESAATKVNAQAIALDDFTEGYGIDKVDVVKIDVDGYDYKVLCGAVEMLREYRPVIYIELCEYALNEQGDSVKDILSLCKDVGYSKFIDELGRDVSTYDKIIDIVGSESSVNGVFSFE